METMNRPLGLVKADGTAAVDTVAKFKEENAARIVEFLEKIIADVKAGGVRMVIGCTIDGPPNMANFATFWAGDGLTPEKLMAVEALSYSVKKALFEGATKSLSAPSPEGE